MSFTTRFTLGLHAPPHMTRLRTSAIVSPAFGSSAGFVLAKGVLVGDPWFTDAYKPPRPCARRLFGLSIWHPLHWSVSPTCTCSQLVCRAPRLPPTRRPLASSTLM